MFVVTIATCFRVRPQSAREVIDCCRVCTNFIPNEPQIVLGSDKAFTYDHVFALQSTQREIFKAIIEELVEKYSLYSIFLQYSLILAYLLTS